MRYIIILTLLVIIWHPLLSQKKCLQGDCKNGFGIEEVKHMRYEGEFKSGYYNGPGIMIFLDSSKWAGDKYTGEFKNGLKNGKGKYEYSHGAIYEGIWTKNKRTGFGTYSWPNGAKYIGEFKNGYRQGLGTYFYPEGEWSKGIWNKDELHGIAYYYFDSLSCYYGDWVRNLRTGKGVYLDTAYIYVGEFKSNSMTGYGEITYLGSDEFAGDYYVGSFNNDFFDGKGVYTDKDGNIEMGIWNNGEFQKSIQLKLKAADYEMNHTVVEMVDNHRCPSDPNKVFFK